MKKSIKILGSLFFIGIITAAFQCNKTGYNSCNTYTNDTAIYTVQLPNYNQVIRVLDTFNIQSIVKDSITTVKGVSFLSNISQITSNLQAYKIEQINQTAAAYYANIQFNYSIKEGYFNTDYGNGFSILYKRQQPFQIFKGALICGSPGLYLVKISNGNYSNYSIRNPLDNCSNISPSFFVDRAHQQIQYWDSLQITSLILANSFNNVLANKNDQDYFFLKVVP